MKRGSKHTPETRQKLSEAARGKSPSMETRRKLSESQRGRQFSDEHRQRISEARMGIARAERSPRWLDGEANYWVVHRRVMRAKGKAREYPCYLCGKDAEQWALDHSCSSTYVEEIDGKDWIYSLDIDDYYPLCRACHRKADTDGGFRA